MHNDKEKSDQSFEIPEWNSTLLASWSLHENLCKDQEIIELIDDKIKVWTSIVDSNPLITEDEKNSIKWNFQLFKKQVENNKLLFDKYHWNEWLFFRKILDKLSEKNMLNQDKKYSFENINDIKINFIWWDFVIEISDDEMNDFFWESFNWLTTPEVKIDGISIYPIVVRKNKEIKKEIIRHELQHFYNKFLINNFGKIEDFLADETIAQTIWWSWWQSAEGWKTCLADCMSRWVQNTNPHNDYTFWNRFNVRADRQIELNQQILYNLENVDVARELRDAWIENYADILAITPINKRKDLKKIYLSE